MKLELILWFFLVVGVIAVALLATMPRLRKELSFRSQVISAIVFTALYAIGWLDGGAKHSPVFLQQAIALAVGSVVGTTLYRWRHRIADLNHN